MLIVASLVTCIDLLSNALLDDLHESLGLFIPLIVTNCALLAQADTVATRKPVGEALLTGLASGLGFVAVLVALGGLRELARPRNAVRRHAAARRRRHRVDAAAFAVQGHARRDLAARRVLRRGGVARAAQLARPRATRARSRAQRRERRGAGAAVKPAKRREIYERFAKANPSPSTELKYTTPFELLVAVVLSAQATDLSVNKATVRAVQGREHAAGDARPRRGRAQGATSRRSGSSTARRRT